MKLISSKSLHLEVMASVEQRNGASLEDSYQAVSGQARGPSKLGEAWIYGCNESSGRTHATLDIFWMSLCPMVNWSLIFLQSFCFLSCHMWKLQSAQGIFCNSLLIHALFRCRLPDCPRVCRKPFILKRPTSCRHGSWTEARWDFERSPTCSWISWQGAWLIGLCSLFEIWSRLDTKHQDLVSVVSMIFSSALMSSLQILTVFSWICASLVFKPEKIRGELPDVQSSVSNYLPLPTKQIQNRFATLARSGTGPLLVPWNFNGQRLHS